MNELSGIDRAVRVSAAVVAVLVLNGCSRFSNPTVARGSYIGQVAPASHVSIPTVVSSPSTRASKAAAKPERARVVTAIDDGTSLAKVDIAPPVTRVDDRERVSKNADVETATKVDGAETVTAFDGLETTPTNDGASVPIENDLEVLDLAPPAPRKSLPMRSLFNANEKFIMETEDEARLRKIMRICAC